MRKFIIAGIMFGSLGTAIFASAQEDAGPTPTPTPHQTETPAAVPADEVPGSHSSREAPRPPDPPQGSPHHNGRPEDDGAASPGVIADKFRWGAAVRQSMIFLALQHGYAVTAQPKTRHALKGPFLKDYFRSVRSLHGWDDGGRFFTNYVAHPMQGSFLGFIQIQNDPKGRSRTFEMSRGYWKSRAKALAWSAAWSTQFEIGPVSQASIGNVGLSGKQTWIDIVMTPTAGTGILVLEDVLDRFVIRPIERRFRNVWVKALTRMLLNPTRTNANLVRFSTPWRRDTGLR